MRRWALAAAAAMLVGCGGSPVEAVINEVTPPGDGGGAESAVPDGDGGEHASDAADARADTGSPESASPEADPPEAGAEAAPEAAPPEPQPEAGSDVEMLPETSTDDVVDHTHCTNPTQFFGGMTPPATCPSPGAGNYCSWSGGPSGCINSAGTLPGVPVNGDTAYCDGSGTYPCCMSLESTNGIECQCFYCP